MTVALLTGGMIAPAGEAAQVIVIPRQVGRLRLRVHGAGRLRIRLRGGG